MRKQVLILLVLGLFCVALGDENTDERPGYGKNDKDDDDKINYEPCDYVDDEDCIRQFFINYGQCFGTYDKKDHLQNNKAVYRKKQAIYLPKFNITLIETNTKITGLDGKVEKFYINKKTENLVMSVNFKGITIESKMGYFEFHRTGKEPVITGDYLNATYIVTLTAIIPIHSGINFKDARVVGYSHVGIPPFYVGPKVQDSKDPIVAQSWNALLADVPTAVQESLLTEAPSFFFAYLQKNICDFNIPISSYS